MFESMLNSLRQDVTQKLAQVRPLSKEEQDAMMAQILAQQQRQAQATAPVAVAAAPAAAPSPATPLAAMAGFVETDPTTWGNPARNDSCPCGSGKKFKYCHGQLV